jgi:glycyl-tRNA synthetase alpha chain
MTYSDVFKRNEREMSAYNFVYANTHKLLQHIKDAEEECAVLLQAKLPLPAYEQCVKASHCFNLLQARGVISVMERASYISRVRALAKGCCELYMETYESKQSIS